MADPFSGSQNSRAGNALQKRQEALKRWKGSETDREPSDRSRKKPQIQFSSGTVFLSAISSGDVDEVKKLLAKDADINFQNVDGLTALHQACIDENYDLVKLLVDKGARLDLRDNEGWTPLHAAASCGSVEIAQYLIDSGADIASVNNEGELPLDLAEEEEMEDLLTEEIESQGIDVVEARGEEERIMIEHAQSWLNKRKVDEILDRSGATALHVACSKGYVKVINLLLQAGVDIDACDKEGWTPVHAAAHWGQQAALEILSEHGANLNARSKLGQTAIDLAEPDIVKLLEELKRKQHDRTSINATTPLIRTNSSGPPPLKRSTLERNSIDHVKELMQHDIENDRSSITRIKDSKLYLGDVKQERATLEANRDVTSPKSKLAKAPSFLDSPKEDNEKNNDKKRGESEESDSEDSEESTEESESEEEPPKSKPTVNSVPNRKAPTANSRPQLESESDGSESETEESSEEEEPSKTSTAGSVRTTPLTRTQSTPSSVTSSTSRQAPYSSRIGNYGSSRSTSFGREEKKEEPAQSRFATYPLRTTGSSTSTTSTADTARNRFSLSSDDNKETEKAAPAKTTRAKKVTRRANTGWVGGPVAGGNEEANSAEKQVNDLDSKKTDNTGSRSIRTSNEEAGSTRGSAFRSAAGRSATPDTDTSSSYVSRRNRLSSSDDRNDTEAGMGRRNYPRLADRNKDNEEPEIPAWKRRLQEREKEREREKEKKEKEKSEKEKAEKARKEKEEKEKAEKEKAEREKAEREKAEREKAEREKAEREKAEKEKENQVPSWRRSRIQEKEKEKEREKEKEKEEETSAQRARRQRRPREKRRGTGVAYMPDESDEDESSEVKDAKKNTKLNEEVEEEKSQSARRRANKPEESATDRFRAGRSSKANALPEITETDPKKLKEKLQDVQVELQDYKVKFEKSLQEKEALKRKLSQTEDELKQVTADNQRLKDENGALIRVISKLSRTPT